MTNATADTMQRTETVPPSRIVTRSTLFCDEVKRRSHLENGLSCFISCLGWYGCHFAPLTTCKDLGAASEQSADRRVLWKSYETTTVPFI